jgi:hypothetical protein
MMASGLGSFVSGAAEGYTAAKEMQRREALQKRDDERFAMEQERYVREKTNAERQDQKERDIEEARQEALQAEKDAALGAGDFAGLADPGAIAARQQATQSVEQKGTASYDRAEARRLGRTVDETQTASVTPAETDILKKGGVGLYKNQKAADDLLVDKQLGAYRKILIARGDIDKAVGLNELAQEMKDKGIARLQKNAAAFVMADADPSIVANAVSKVYGFAKDGKEIDPARSTQDAKTGAYSFAVVDQTTGAVEQKVMSKEQLLTGLAQFTPAKLYEFKLAREDRAEDKATAAAIRKEDVKLAERGLAVKEKEAGATLAFRNAQMIALGDQVKGADAKAKAETIDKSFPYADKMFKPEDLFGKSDAEKQQLQSMVAADTRSRNYAVGLASLNPKIDPRIIIGASKAASSTYPNILKDKSGRSYFSYGGSQIYID